MANLATRDTRGNLCLAFRPPQCELRSEAWKKLIGNKAVCTRLEMLPEAKARWTAFLTSTILQIVVTGSLLAAPALFPYSLVNKTIYQAVPIVAPQTDVALPARQPEVPAKINRTPPAIEELLPPQHLAKLIAPTPLHPAEPNVASVKSIETPTLDDISSEAKFELPSSEPARPREPVKTGTLTTASASAATASKPPEQVQTGGFGDPNGLPGDSNLSMRANIAHSGSIALLPGPGYGDGAGGERGVRGTVAKPGFGDAAATSPASSGGGARSTIRTGGFETITTDAPRPKQADAPSAVQPVVILAKPNPSYSDEARKLGLEGEVLVEVIFLASGEVQVVRVSKGLGHGLDEAAVRAAQKIRFKPALQDGKPTDFPAIVHIEFRLAF